MTNFIFSCFWLHVLMFSRHADGGFPEVFWGFVRTIFWAFFCGITNKLRDIFLPRFWQQIKTLLTRQRDIFQSFYLRSSFVLFLSQTYFCSALDQCRKQKSKRRTTLSTRRSVTSICSTNLESVSLPISHPAGVIEELFHPEVSFFTFHCLLCTNCETQKLQTTLKTSDKVT